MPDTPEPTMAIRLRSLMGGISVYTFVQSEEADSRRVEGSQEGGGGRRISRSCMGQERGVIDRHH
jgi:hypothetical protein